MGVCASVRTCVSALTLVSESYWIFDIYFAVADAWCLDADGGKMQRRVIIIHHSVPCFHHKLFH